MASKKKQKREVGPSEDELVALGDLVAMMPPEASVGLNGELFDRDAILRHLVQLIAVARAERRATHGGLHLVANVEPDRS